VSKILEFLVARLSEKSSWVGIAALVAAFGVNVFGDAAFVEQFSGLGLALIGVVAFLVKDKAA